jgi:hypothetical protein
MALERADASARIFTALQKAISLIEEQSPVFRRCFFERRGDILLIVPHPFAHQVRSRLGNQGDGELLAQVLCELGLARAGRPVEKHRTARPLFQTLQNVFWRKAYSSSRGNTQSPRVCAFLSNHVTMLFGCVLSPARPPHRDPPSRAFPPGARLHGGFELRARYTVELQNLGGGSLGQLELLHPHLHRTCVFRAIRFL